MKTASHLMGGTMFFKDKLVPKPIRVALKYAVLSLLDIKYYVLHGFSSGIPAPTRSNMEAVRYIEIGDELLTYFKEFAGLRPSEKVLDVGCGFGRLGLPLTKFLGAEGEYHGFVAQRP